MNLKQGIQQFKLERNDDMKLSKDELLNVTGGGISIGAVTGIGALITFIIGIVDGYLRPSKCS